MLLFRILLPISAFVSSVACWGVHSDGLTIQTTSGLVRGFINETAPNVRQFLGIPYAEPPVGQLRFAPPKPKQHGGSLDATAFGPSCIQQFSNTSTIYTEVVPEFLIEGGQSEDCLFINIWAPAVKRHRGYKQPGESLLPVFVYIPGGGFTGGGANSLYKIPDKWIQRTQSHIVMVINYRVNIFGFPNARGLKDRNVGLLDQRLAVEWARDNAAAFGGDPSRITLWGQSAGAASSDTYIYAYPEDPIISSFISDSGSASLLGSADQARTNFTFLASLLGCKEPDAQAELACMRTIPATTLENTLSNYIISKATPSISFVPVYDNKTAFSNTTDRALRGLLAKIPGMLGSNANEGAGFVAFTPNGPGAAALHAITQRVIACPVALEVSNRVLVGLPTYRYQYAGNFSNVSPVGWMGAYHSSELPLLFGTHYEYGPGLSTPFEYDVSHAMEGASSVFVVHYLPFCSLLTSISSLGLIRLRSHKGAGSFLQFRLA
ncbi:hypothetical protein LTR50_001739 [Elasticomyces elasticus]|nr:hypothetical protein LTR50_001739 [Elasticomyces elasticus]